MMNFTDLSDEVITGRLMAIVKDERKSLVEFLGCLAELERRRTILALGFPSTFSYCSEHLRLSNGSAFRRTKGARLLARFPASPTTCATDGSASRSWSSSVRCSTKAISSRFSTAP
jgi:hypothetical protein